MTVYVKIKALSKQKPMIGRTAFEIDKQVGTSKELIKYIVQKNVAEYNKTTIDKPLFLYLSKSELDDGAIVGKIGFHDRKNENNQDPKKAVENALQCFEDGIFKLFINDEEKGVNQPVTLREGDEITLMRLTMLAGRLW